MEPRVTLITLGVKDLDISADFYENKFGWTRSSTSNESIIFFKLNGIYLAIFGENELAEDAGISADGAGFKKFTLAHNMQSEEEVDSLFAELESKGVKVVKRPQKVFWGGYSSYVADPDGNLWEIAYNPFW